MPIRPLPFLAVAVAAVVLGGCTTTQSTRAKSLKPAEGTVLGSVAECRHLTVVPFGVPSGKRVDPLAGKALAQDVERRLGSDFGTLFETVEFADARRNLDGECVLDGAISKYRKGSRVARAILMGLGSASLEGQVRVVDPSGKALLEAPFDKLWAWGGLTGALKGMEEMTEEVSASIAATVARAKGWNPPAAAAQKQ
jgi:hypothetical protein